MMTLQVLAAVLCLSLLFTLIRDREVMTLEARIIDGVFLFGMITAGAGSVFMWWEVVTLLSLTGYGAMLFTGGLWTVFLALKIQDPLVLRSFSNRGN